jgi:hypothetical protein
MLTHMTHPMRLAVLVATAAFIVVAGVGKANAGQGGEQRISGAALAAHPVAAVAAEYLELLHSNNMAGAMALATRKAQAEFKAEPADEQQASADFRRRILPTGAEFDQSLGEAGLLIVEADGTATLNLVKTTPATASSTGSSATVTIPFALEDGRWKIAR